MGSKYLRTSDLARAVGIHPNTVRLYEQWGLIPPVERSPAGYRRFTQRHLDCLRLARTIYASDYPGRALRAAGNQVIQCAVVDDWFGAQSSAHAYLASVQSELARASSVAVLLEQWAQKIEPVDDDTRMAIGAISKMLGVSYDVIRNWERNGLVSVPRNSHNNYRQFGRKEIERMQIIRMLSGAGYSHMAILRMFNEMDQGNIVDLKKVLDTPGKDEDIFTAADHWLSTLQGQERLAQLIVQMVEEQISGRDLEQ